jgi:glutamate racemase
VAAIPRSQNPAARSTAPIGVFDSGMGGLTVLEALRRSLPDESFLYLGDTARLPYGTKSPQTVQRYAVQAAHVLVDRGIKALVVACNTASAVALPALQARYLPLPVYGVVAPGARAAAEVANSGRVLVLATESTVSGGAYQRSLLTLRPALQVLARPCPLLVTLAEEGRHDGPLVALALQEYLRGMVASSGASPIDTLLLGCTHFPVFRRPLLRILGEAGLGHARVVDSAETTAAAVAAEIAAGRLPAAASNADGATLNLLATDGRERFRRVGAYFLGHSIDAVELVDL